MLTRLRKFVKDESGASAVEYALLVAGIAVVCMVAIFALGGTISDKFDEIGNKIGGVVSIDR